MSENLKLSTERNSFFSRLGHPGSECPSKPGALSLVFPSTDFPLGPPWPPKHSARWCRPLSRKLALDTGALKKHQKKQPETWARGGGGHSRAESKSTEGWGTAGGRSSRSKEAGG